MIRTDIVRCPVNKTHRVVYDWGSLTYRWWCLDCGRKFYTKGPAG